MRPATASFVNCGLELDDRGFIVTDAYMQTNNPDIFACGDCASTAGLAGKVPHNIMLWHAAKAGGHAAGLNVLGPEVPTPVKPCKVQTLVNIGTQAYAGIGEIPPQSDDLVSWKFGNRSYQLILKDGCLVQAQSLGDPQALGVLQPLLGKPKTDLASIKGRMPWLHRVSE
jgi:hypothetical protein